MEEDLFTKQQLLIPPETSLERTLRTGQIDFMGLAMREAMPELVTIFDDVIERPEHYYNQSKNIMAAASNLGSLMVDEAIRALGEGTINDVQCVRKAIWPSFYKHLGHSFGPFDSSANISDDNIYDMQKGLEQQRAAYNLLMDSLKIPGSGYEFTVLRSYDGLAAKALCLIVDAPDQTMRGSELQTQLSQPGTLDFLLGSLINLRVIDVAWSTNEYYDGLPTDTAYQAYQGPRSRTSDDSELMVLARHYARHYDETAANGEESQA